MTSRKMLVAGNWKMHGTRQTATELAEGLRDNLAELAHCDVLVCPPLVHLGTVGPLLAETAIALGAQNSCAEPDDGAFTGEVSANMLADSGCRFVLVGHSERRALFGETDAVVAAKFAAVLAAGLTPVLCVGETQAERESGQTAAVLSRQLAAVVDHCQVDAFERSVLAYEPVWAIGTGLTAAPEQAQEVHAQLRAQIANDDAIIAARLRILYGGSVKPDNANALFSCPDIDGGLIGGASLKSEQFLAICDAAEATASV